MSKQYLVLYNYNSSITTYDSQYKADKYSFKTVQMKPFTDQQEAADFAAKYDGYIVLPAQVSSVIKEID